VTPSQAGLAQQEVGECVPVVVGLSKRNARRQVLLGFVGLLQREISGCEPVVHMGLQRREAELAHAVEGMQQGFSRRFVLAGAMLGKTESRVRRRGAALVARKLVFAGTGTKKLGSRLVFADLESASRKRMGRLGHQVRFADPCRQLLRFRCAADGSSGMAVANVLGCLGTEHTHPRIRVRSTCE
jgi:hypothetical protein